MAINFTQFEDDLTSYFSSNVAENEDAAATFVSNLYESYIRTGTDSFYQNGVLNYNKEVLKSALLTAFIVAKGNSEFLNSNLYAQTISNGLIGFWTGAQLILGVPPPSSTVVISNTVTFPGNPQSLSVLNTSLNNLFAKKLIQMFRVHLLTISGITVATVPSVGPVPFSWQGFK